MAKRLAFMTYGELLAPFGDELVQPFVDRVPAVYDAASATPGFIDRSHRNLGDYSHSWGEIVSPRCWGGVASRTTAATLSIWEDLESVTAFAYHGHHGEAMKHRNDWFTHPGLPEHVGWWIDENEPVTFELAAARMDHLFDNGSSPFAFSLRQPFSADGQPVKINPERVREKAAAATVS